MSKIVTAIRENFTVNATAIKKNEREKEIAFAAMSLLFGAPTEQET